MALKKKISKEELRKAMLEAKKKHSTIKKIESPLASLSNTYNELDQLVCIICKTVVRSEAVWPVHLNSRSHKENIALAKKNELNPTNSVKSIISNKRLCSFQEPQEPKRVKGILKNATQPTASVTTNLPPNFFDTKTLENNKIVLPNLMNGSSINSETINSEETLKGEKEVKEANQSILPEGFFDDPKMDAKARNVEYKDPIEEEWERFQKEIKEETAQSAQIIGDDQEEAATERQLDVIEEQLRNWSRVMDLVKHKELVQTAEKKQDNNDSSSDEEDFDEFLDWRAKKSYRD